MKSRTTSLSPIFDEVELRTTKIPVPQDKVSWIVGKGGYMLEALQKKWLVKLEIVKERDINFVNITEYQKYGILGPACIGIRYLCTDEALESFEDIPTELAGLVIGRNGEIRKEIELTYRVRIITSPTSNHLNAEFKIFGLPDDRCKAKAMMREKCSLDLEEMEAEVYYEEYEQMIEGNEWDEQLVGVENSGNGQAETEDDEPIMEVEPIEAISINNNFLDDNTNFPDDLRTPSHTAEIFCVKFDHEDDMALFCSIHKENIKNQWGVDIICENQEVKITFGTEEDRRAAYDEVKQRKGLIALMRNYNYYNAKKFSEKDQTKKESLMEEDKNKRRNIIIENKLCYDRIIIPEKGGLYIGTKGETIKQIQKNGGTWIDSDNLIDNKGYLEIYGSEANIKKTRGLLSKIVENFKLDSGQSNKNLRPTKRTIKDNDKNCGFDNLFRDCACKPTNEITIEEPDLKKPHMRSNFYKWCQAMRRLFPNGELKLNLKTPFLQMENITMNELSNIKNTLLEEGIHLSLNFTSEHVDRSINFHNGYEVYLTNGLDLYKKVPGRLDNRDLNRVPCKGGTLSFHTSFNTN